MAVSVITVFIDGVNLSLPSLRLHREAVNPEKLSGALKMKAG
jgi:hypothetical protein